MSEFSNPVGGAAAAAAKYTQALLDVLGGREPLAVLRELPGALRTAVDGLSVAELARPEAAGKWSIAHVLEHLTDQETVVQINGMGPFDVTYVNPDDDPRRQKAAQR